MGLLGLNLSAGVFSVNDEYITDFERNDEFETSSTPWRISNNSTMPVFLDLDFFEYKKFQVSIGIGYQHLYTNQAIVDFDPATGLNSYEDVNLNMFMIMPDFRLNWVTSADRNFQLYSSFSFGLNFINEKHSVLREENDSYKHPSIQVTGAGVRFGDKVAGFMEVGIGSRGFLVFGISTRFYD